MSGNVWEWTSTIFADYPYVTGDGRESNDDVTSYRTLRGGSWYDALIYVYSAYRIGLHPSYWDFTDGVRCARSYADS